MTADFEKSNAGINDLELDRIFAFPISKHVTADRTGSSRNSQRFRALKKRIVLLATSRSGSEYLSSLLQDLGIVAHEYLNPRSSVSRGHAIGDGQDPSEFLASVMDHLPDGIFCTKANIQALMPLFEIGEFPTHLPDWHFIHISRTNVIRQAISLLLAEKTGSYRDDLKPHGTLYHEDLTYAAIASQLEQVFAARDWLERFIAVFGLAPLRVNYEDLLAAPHTWLDRIASYLGISVAPGQGKEWASPPRPRPQSTRLNDQLEAAFRAEMLHRLTTGRASREFLLPEPGAAAGSSDVTLPRRPTTPPTTAEKPTSLRIDCAAGDFEHETAHCWLYRLRRPPDAEIFERHADRVGANFNSPLLLYENDRLLGPAHATHSVIRSEGKGAYSHWRDDLYFSSSDNTDPNRNGRRYAIVLASR
jgi:LPS sulfotransferase NodH